MGAGKKTATTRRRSPEQAVPGRRSARELPKTSARGSGTGSRTRAVAARRTKVRRAKTGAPSALTPENVEQIVSVLRAGAYFEHAMRYARLSPSVGYKWLARGRREIDRVDADRSEGLDSDVEDPERPFVEFVQSIEHAEAEAEAFHVLNVRRLAQSDDHAVALRASLAYLERKHPEKWSRSQRSEIAIGAEIRQTISVEVQEQRTLALVAAAIEVGAFEAAQASLADRGKR